MTGKTSDVAHPFDYIKLSVIKFKNTTGVFSIVQSQAAAEYFHNGVVAKALGGVVTITAYSSSTISGYFSFDTDDDTHIRDGLFMVNRF